jgi:hypothetical protein
VSTISVDANAGEIELTRSHSRAVAILYAATLFLSAFLLFQVQLILGKYILPWFGGTAAVWTTSLLFFQVLLLCGYVYSHLLSERVSPAWQSRLHLGLLAVALLVVVGLSFLWPSAITPSLRWRSLHSQWPVLDVMLLLLVASGLPFFVLSTTGPLLQHWFARQGGDARTYRLYAVSNLGSLLGLLSFPFLLEPTLRMTTQGRLWAILFCCFAAGCGWCAWKCRDCAEETYRKATTLEAADKEQGIGARVLWFALPACASALLLATSNLLCQELVSIPLLWVVPLALYLLSFILCFDHPRWYRREVFQPLFVLGVFVQWATMHFGMTKPQAFILPLLLFVACMICHGELARLKPGVGRLTSFYLAIAAGGALGGVFVVLVAPQVFSFFAEYQISLAAGVVLLTVCLFRDRSSWVHTMGLGLTAAISAGVLVAAFAGGQWLPALQQLLSDMRFYPLALLVVTLVLVGAYIQRSSSSGASRFRAGQALVVAVALLAIMVEYQNTQSDPRFYLRKRNFYGALRVFRMQQGGNALLHGQTLHGSQLFPPYDHMPLAYYGPDSAIGIVLQNHPKRMSAGSALRVGIVGLGAGSLAAYGQPGDYFRYYEINPDVIALAAGPKPVFTFVRDSQARVDTRQGDARLLLEQEAATGQRQNFDVLVLDAFSGDAVPVHLLTTEAFDTYWKHLNPEHGLIAVHITSRHINLLPVLGGIAQHYDAAMLVRLTPGNYPFLDNLWAILARRADDLRIQGLVPNPPPLEGHVPPQLWTDDYSNIVRLLY